MLAGALVLMAVALTTWVVASPQDCAPETTVEACVNCYIANWWDLAAAEPYPPTPQQAAAVARDAEGFCYAVQCLPLLGCPAPDCIGPRPVGCP